MNDYMEQMAKNAEQEGRDFTDGQNQDQQQIDKKDIDQMMKNLEDMANTGAREQAMKMLNELREMMERMQAGKQNPQAAKKQQQMQHVKLESKYQKQIWSISTTMAWLARTTHHWQQ